MARESAAPTASQNSAPSGGLFISGRILARSTRNFPQQDGTVRVCTTYRVLGGIDIFHVDEWKESGFLPIGTEIEAMPVTVRAFKGRGGEAIARLTFVQDAQ